MLPTIYMTKGLPASGKSTWAKKFVGDGSVVKRINKDDLRNMSHNYVFSRSNERAIHEARNAILATYLGLGFSVVLDDTNLDPRNEKEIKGLYPAHEVVEVGFLTVSPEECIARDALRTGTDHVGYEVIMRMYNKWLKPKGET
jgi:predicted kinase